MGLFFNRKKKAASSGAMQLMGMPGDLNTNKCLLTAEERGMAVEFKLIDLLAGGNDAEDYRAMSPLGKTPCLKDGEFVTSGAYAVMTYLDTRAVAKSPSLNPKKAAHLGLQNTWADAGMRYMDPAISTMMQQCVFASMTGGSPDEAALQAARETVTGALEKLNAQLEGNDFIAGPYSFADIHWTVYAHALDLCGYSELLDTQPNVKAWSQRIKERKNKAGKSTYAALPSLDDVKAKQVPTAA